MMKKRIQVTAALVLVCSVFGVLNGFCAGGYDLAADAKRKVGMSPEEVAWELVLEQNLGNLYLPLYKKAKLAGREHDFDFVKDQPSLPRVLLIGDSISKGYTLPVRHALSGKANLHRAPANCGSTAMGLKNLTVWLGKGKWDIIHFNFGIWNINTKDEVYAAELEKIVEQLKKTGAQLVWARTTPAGDKGNAEGYTPAKCDRVNRIADAIMQKHGIPINDLYTAVAPKLAELQKAKNVHFNAEGNLVLGKQVAAVIQSHIK